MALTPIPQRVDDPKDAVLWSILNKLETIDETTGTRVAFGTSLVYNAHMSLDRPIFKDELDQIYAILKIQPPKEEPKPETVEAIRTFDEPELGTTLRDI